MDEPKNVILNDAHLSYDFRQVWRLATSRSSDIRKQLNENGINYTAYLDNNSGQIVYVFIDEEHYNMAKFFI